MNSVEKVIARIRDSHPDNEWLYMNGQCYNFSLIIQEIFGGEAWYDYVGGHVYTEINGFFYDVRGKHHKKKLQTAHLGRLRDDKNIKPWRWGRRDTRRLVEAKSTI